MRQTAVLKDPFTLDILQTERKSWTGIRRSLRSAARSERTTLGVVEAEQAKIFSQIKQLRKAMDTASDRQEVKLIEEKMTALLRAIRDHGLPLIQVLRQGPNAEQTFDSAYSAESMEKIVRLEAALDARISRVLARLVGLKEFKRTPAAGTRAALTGSPNS
jgi:hypothetical protein